MQLQTIMMSQSHSIDYDVNRLSDQVESGHLKMLIRSPLASAIRDVLSLSDDASLKRFSQIMQSAATVVPGSFVHL
jgi:hypothetical protein